MDNCCDNPVHICAFPTELLLHIFKFIGPRSVVCRQVCKRWKLVVDSIISDDALWEQYCSQSYKDVCIDAKKKSASCRSWFDLYRSLTLWNRLHDSTELTDQFCQALAVADEIRDLKVINNGTVAIHKRAKVEFYNLASLSRTDREPIHGDFNTFFEFDDIIVTLGCHLHLRIMKKIEKTLHPSKSSVLDSCGDDSDDDEAIFYNTKSFLVNGREVYSLNMNNEVHLYNIDNNTAVQLNTINDTIVTMSFQDDHLNILTLQRNVYTYKNNAFEKLFQLDQKENMLDCLWRYKFIENMDWFKFYVWMRALKRKLPPGPLIGISLVRVYCEVFFIGYGTQILIYNKPFINGQLDLINCPPVKQINLIQYLHEPYIILRPILNIDVVEISGGHKVLIAVPNKVLVVTYAQLYIE